MTHSLPRRDFLKICISGATTISALRLDPVGLQFTQLERKGPPKKVVVVGAGLAGLAAAYELSEAGHHVTVLEAQTRPGGRVYTLREPFPDGLYAEAGAQVFVPGEPDYAMRYIKLFNLPLAPPEPSGPPCVYHLRGKRTTALVGEPIDWALELTPEEKGLGLAGMRQKYIEPAVEELARASAAWWPREVLEKYDSMSFAEFLRRQGASADAIELLSIIDLDFVGEGADSVSALYVLAEERLAYRKVSGPFYRIKGGNDLLPRALAARSAEKIHYGVPVVRIEQDSRGVRVVYLQAGSERTITADYVICAIPFSILRHVEVSPSFSPEKQRAISDLPYASLCIFQLQMRKRFWLEEGLSGYAATDLPVPYLWDSSSGQPGARGILRAYFIGPHARRATTMGEGDGVQFVLEQTKKVYPQIEEWYEGSASKCWGHGCGAWFRPGQMTSLLPHIARPEGRVHFAGEHTAPLLLHFSMQGALQSGIRAAQEINEAP